MANKPQIGNRHQQHVTALADTIIKALEAGTAPWIRPWKAGEIVFPENPVSGAKYRGSNLLKLMMASRVDSRWMTYRQARSIGAQVRKGERGTGLIFWITRDAEGDELERPKLKLFTVFNAEQIDGIPPQDVEYEPVEWKTHERATQILENSGAAVSYGGDRALYSPSRDRIYMPRPETFSSAGDFYETILHELGHWTGHPDRLNRPFGVFGDATYAQEELRAEIGSMMVCMELGIGHNPGNHVNYIGDWIKKLKEEPNEIYAACRDAAQIKLMVCGFELGREAEKEAAREKEELELG